MVCSNLSAEVILIGQLCCSSPDQLVEYKYCIEVPYPRESFREMSCVGCFLLLRPFLIGRVKYEFRGFMFSKLVKSSTYR